MEVLFTREYYLFWALALGLALYYPVRQLIWVMYVRKVMRQSKKEIDPAEQQALKKRATATSILICFLFSVLYTGYLFNKP